MQARLLWIKDIDLQVDKVGGKAAGLHKLIKWGLDVPSGFVIVEANKSFDKELLANFYQSMGKGKVAVRSSALGEDGSDHSFAGLYETVLNVEGDDPLVDAVQQCLDSLNSHRASEYRQQNEVFENTIENTMCVVVQRMVDPQAAGVLFSVDPVSGRHDRLVIDAVAGLGEALVSGDETPDHYEFDMNNGLVFEERVGNDAILCAAQRLQLVQQARDAVVAAGEPLDMEWAIDQRGQLFWLQARPVTTVGSDLNELNTPVNHDDVLTRCNIGEMMPGASCPLTFSTTGKAIEHGMQHMHVSYASRPAVTNDWTQVAMASGKMFINLSGSAVAAATVLGIDVKSMGLSLCGRIVDELKPPPKRSLLIRLKGMLKMLKYLQQADAVIDDFSRRAKDFQLPTEGSSAELAKALDEAQAFFYEAFAVHLQSSTTSGFASNILQAMISGGQQSSPEEQAEAGRLMAGARGVESAVLVDQLDAISAEVSQHRDVQSCFVEADPYQALAWLCSERSAVADKFSAFLARHGHRSYRELCVREVCWGDAPQALVATMQASVAARLVGMESSMRPETVDLSTLSRGLRWIVPKAHNAVRRREATKSLLVDITNRIKRGYRALGHQLVAEQKLGDADSVFFFLHDELMAYVHNSASPEQQSYWNHHTKMRRRALNFQNRLNFNEICVGAPEPIDSRTLITDNTGQLIGRPVSRGIVEARARVALSVTEAVAIQPGEILVAPITDVGWTPYFSMIAGLITDVGSAVSHGAVIAREYGLPAIVNTRTGTKQIKTGDTIRLDADTGVVTIL